jgi:hypothetical protein
MFQPQGNIDDLDIGAPALGLATALPAYFESNAGGYINFYPRSGEEERQAELRRERERILRRRRNGGVGAERRRWVWRNGKGGKGKRRERRRDENGRFV